MRLKILDAVTIANAAVGLDLVFAGDAVFGDNNLRRTVVTMDGHDDLVQPLRVDLPAHGGVRRAALGGAYPAPTDTAILPARRRRHHPAVVVDPHEIRPRPDDRHVALLDRAFHGRVEDVLRIAPEEERIEKCAVDRHIGLPCRLGGILGREVST